MTSTRPIRALLRGLEVLHVLNQHNGATVSEVASAIDLPRTTTYRILETLCHAGYAYRATSDERYRLTILVRGLSDGFDDEAWVTQIARPYMYELCAELVWPIAIATLSGSSMLIRQTTDHRSPLAVEKRGPGFRVAMLGSASGVAYLTWCPKEQREALLDLLAKSRRPEDQPAANRKKVYDLLVETRKRGYAAWRRQRRGVRRAQPLHTDSGRGETSRRTDYSLFKYCHTGAGSHPALRAEAAGSRPKDRRCFYRAG